MRTHAAVVVVAAATVIGSGAALAAEKGAPETGTQEYQLALETGALPASEFAKLQKESSLADASVPTIEIGGLVYRLGVDTH